MATSVDEFQGYLYQPFDISFQVADDDSGDSKLIQCVRNKNLRGALTLLSNGGNPDYQNPNTGDTPLHVAVQLYDLTLVKLLLIFDANLQMKNKANLTALELAINEGDKAAECASAIQKVLDLRQRLQNDKPREAAPCKPRMPSDEEIFLLSLDGGGIKGLVFIQVLIEIEKRCTQLYPDSESFLSYFNWIGGNSTGGIAALAVAGLKYHPRQGRKFYLQLKNEVLAGDYPYPTEQVESVFKHAFGTTKTMKSIKAQNVTIMTTLATVAPPKLHIMTNYGDSRDRQVGPDERLVWEAARATSAAIPYFHPFGSFIDGGFIANNPTTDTVIDILLHTEKEKRDANIKFVLSMGCGYIEPKVIEHTAFKPLPKVLNALAKMVNMHDQLVYLRNLGATFSLVDLMSAQIVQPCAEVSQRAEMISKVVGAKYYRLNPEIDHISFIESRDEQIIDMMFTTLVNTLKPEMMKQIDEIIDHVVGSNNTAQD